MRYNFGLLYTIITRVWIARSFVLFYSVLERRGLYGWYMDMDMDGHGYIMNIVMLRIDRICGRKNHHLISPPTKTHEQKDGPGLALFGHVWLFYLPWFVFTYLPMQTRAFRLWVLLIYLAVDGVLWRNIWRAWDLDMVRDIYHLDWMKGGWIDVFVSAGTMHWAHKRWDGQTVEWMDGAGWIRMHASCWIHVLFWDPEIFHTLSLFCWVTAPVGSGSSTNASLAMWVSISRILYSIWKGRMNECGVLSYIILSVHNNNRMMESTIEEGQRFEIFKPWKGHGI